MESCLQQFFRQVVFGIDFHTIRASKIERKHLKGHYDPPARLVNSRYYALRPSAEEPIENLFVEKGHQV
jgi:hypothetical protein